MRLAVLGPAEGNRPILRDRARFTMDRLSADRILYLGVDGLLDEVVREWASEIVDGDPSDAAVWKRAVENCATSDHRTIDAFLHRERQRAALQKFACLPHAQARTVEMFQGLLTVIIFDKALLDEEDILPATLLVFGKGKEPLIHRVGQRTFISPGPLSHPQGGVALLAEEDGEIFASVYGPGGDRVRHEPVASLVRSAKLTVQGAGS
jgi:hypothetical protein